LGLAQLTLGREREREREQHIKKETAKVMELDAYINLSMLTKSKHGDCRMCAKSKHVEHIESRAQRNKGKNRSK
jgi:hypothetical protein